MMKKNILLRTLLIVLFLVASVACKDGKHGSFDLSNRDTWQMPDKVISSLVISPASRIADLGSGEGYFLFRLADAVGAAGKVYAVDVDEKIQKRMHKKVLKNKYTNIEMVLAKYHDPLLPEPVDLIFASNSYHHLEDRTNYFKNAMKYLRSGGRVAIVDFREGAFHHFTRSEVIHSEMQAAGYRLETEHDFLPKQHFLVFSKGEN